MSLYFLKNAENKLKKSILKTEDLSLCNNQDKKIFPLFKQSKNKIFFDSSFLKNFCIFFFNRLIYTFLYKTSHNVFSRKNKKKIFFMFILFYKYINFFFFKQGNFSSKKFFIKKKIFYLKPKKFPLFNKLIRFKRSIPVLKKKKVDFLRKYIKSKTFFFRKNNSLIFNKKFLKAFSKKRIETTFVYSLIDKLNLVRLLKIAKFKFSFFYFFDILAKKKIADIFHKRYHYLFHYKRFAITVKVRKKIKDYHKKKKRILLTFNRKWRRDTLSFYNFFLKKGNFVYAKKRRRFWKLCYPFRKEYPENLLFAKFFKLNLDFFNKFKVKKKNDIKKNKNFFFLKKKNKRKNKILIPLKNFRSKVLYDYLSKYCEKLSKRYSKKKKFVNTFFFKYNSHRRNKNFFYYLKFKKKIFSIRAFNFFGKIKNFKKLSFSSHFYSFFLKKIFFKKRKFSKMLSIFYFSKILFKKLPIFFNLKNFFIKFNFIKKKRLLKRFKIRIYGRKRWKFIFLLWKKRKRRKFLRMWFRKKMLRLFIVLLFLRFLKKSVNFKKVILFRNAHIMNNLKKFNFRFVSYIFSNFSSFYFGKNKNLKNSFFVERNPSNKVFFLLKKS